MESTTKTSGSVNESQCAVFAFDISKDFLNFFSQIGAKIYERCFRNRSDVVETQLSVMVELAKKAGVEKILVVAESPQPSNTISRALAEMKKTMNFLQRRHISLTHKSALHMLPAEKGNSYQELPA